MSSLVFTIINVHIPLPLLQECLICIQTVSVSPKSDDELRYCVDDGSKLSFGFRNFVESPR